MQNLLDIYNLYKRYGKKTALEGINLHITPGKIIGLLGPNGSGKSTLIKIIAGLLQPSAGDVQICGSGVSTFTKSVVSYLPDTSYLSDTMNVSDIIKMFSDFYEDFDSKVALEMIGRLDISLSDRLKTMSKGTKEKIQLILVMSRQAKLYLLDEPIGGVDPAARDYILNTILSTYNRGATIIISTHLIYDVEPILDEAIFLAYGKILVHDSVDGVKRNTGKTLEEYFKEVFKC